MIPDNEVRLPIFLAHGITRVREMGGDIADKCSGGVQKSRMECGSALESLTSGLKLDGPKPGPFPLTDPASARSAVNKVKTMASDTQAFGSPPTGLQLRCKNLEMGAVPGGEPSLS